MIQILLSSLAIFCADLDSEIPSIAKIENVEIQYFIKDFFQHISYERKVPCKIDAATLQNYLCDDCIFESYGQIYSRNIPEYIARCKELRKNWSSVSFSSLLEKPILSGDQAIVFFQLRCAGWWWESYLINVTAIVSFRNGKISHWKEIYHSY